MSGHRGLVEQTVDGQGDRVLQGEVLLSEERTRLLLSWRHSGFGVHTSVTVPPDDRDGLERLARYLLRPPVSLDRLRVGEGTGSLLVHSRTSLARRALR